MVDDSTTWIARLTPPGRGAIATLALLGPQAWDVTQALFHPISKNVPLSLEDVDCSQFWYGTLGQELSDEVVVTVKRTKPTPWVEVHCHGGPEVVHVLLDAFENQGATICEWQDFLRRTAGSEWEAMATEALTQAKTVRTAGILLDQQQGAFTRALEQDSPDFERILQFEEVGKHLTTPWRIAIAGAPNVGKSSLINALAGHQRAIVSETPGTTRDLVSVTFAIEGWPMEFIDTAGIREQAEDVEQAGIELTLSTLEQVDFCWWLIETTAEPILPPTELTIPTQMVLNKSDLSPTWDLETVSNVLRISTISGNGIQELCEDLIQRLIPITPEPGEAIPFNAKTLEMVGRTVPPS